ncbi:hypothetical protein Ancab_029722 [Ancistrocladus abbreviatus]
MFDKSWLIGWGDVHNPRADKLQAVNKEQRTVEKGAFRIQKSFADALRTDLGHVGHTPAQSSEGERVQPPPSMPRDNSISDSNMQNMNRLFLKNAGPDDGHVQAEEVWVVGCALGAFYDGDELELFMSIMNMEVRDKVEWEKRKRAEEVGRDDTGAHVNP